VIRLPVDCRDAAADYAVGRAGRELVHESETGSSRESIAMELVRRGVSRSATYRTAATSVRASASHRPRRKYCWTGELCVMSGSEEVGITRTYAASEKMKSKAARQLALTSKANRMAGCLRGEGRLSETLRVI
jgi:hypothetical protein